MLHKHCVCAHVHMCVCAIDCALAHVPELQASDTHLGMFWKVCPSHVETYNVKHAKPQLALPLGQFL